MELKSKFKAMLPLLNKRQSRICLSTEAEYLGHEGATKVAKLAGVSRVVIKQ